jgi:hypothetical protein
VSNTRGVPRWVAYRRGPRPRVATAETATPTADCRTRQFSLQCLEPSRAMSLPSATGMTRPRELAPVGITEGLNPHPRHSSPCHTPVRRYWEAGVPTSWQLFGRRGRRACREGGARVRPAHCCHVLVVALLAGTLVLIRKLQRTLVVRLTFRRGSRCLELDWRWPSIHLEEFWLLTWRQVHSRWRNVAGSRVGRRV